MEASAGVGVIGCKCCWIIPLCFDVFVLLCVCELCSGESTGVGRGEVEKLGRNVCLPRKGKWRTSQGGTRWCGAERDSAAQDGAARGVEPREAESQPLTEVPGQAGPDEGEGVEVVAPLVRKKRRLVRLGEATTTTEAPQADETKGSGVSVGQLEERPLAMVPAGELPLLALLPAVAQRQAGRVVRRGRAVQVRETHKDRKSVV